MRLCLYAIKKTKISQMSISSVRLYSECCTALVRCTPLPPPPPRAYVLRPSQATLCALPGAGGAAVPCAEQASGRSTVVTHWQWSAVRPAPTSGGEGSHTHTHTHTHTHVIRCFKSTEYLYMLYTLLHFCLRYTQLWALCVGR